MGENMENEKPIVHTQVGGSEPVETGNLSGGSVIASKGPKDSVGRKAFVVIIVIVLIMMAFMAAFIMLAKTTAAVGPQNGDYIEYSLTSMVQGQNSTGELRIDFQNVTASSFDMLITESFNGTTSKIDTRCSYSGNDWLKNYSGESYLRSSAMESQIIPVNQQTISTVYGQKLTNHYIINQSNATLEEWVDISNYCPYKSILTFDGGATIVIVLTQTNIGSIDA